MGLEIRPITFRQACEFIDEYHRHNKSSRGCKFSVACYDGDKLVGVATAGRPVSRVLDDGFTCEINRVCTDGTYNACSMLYGACCRIAKDMGYRKIITYTLESENGASVKASGFICDGQAGGVIWTGKRESGKDIPHEIKIRWHKDLKVRYTNEKAKDTNPCRYDGGSNDNAYSGGYHK